MREPTDEQLREYADKLPAIYRDILAAFPGVAPRRRAGEGLMEETIEQFVADHSPDHRPEDVADGLGRLADRGFLGRDDRFVVYTPTPLGERLLHVVTGHTPVTAAMPDLPVPTWG